MALNVKVSTAWKAVGTVSANIGGTWKNVEKIHTNISGTWKEVFNRGLDVYTKILLHCDGSDGASTFTDETGRTWTRAGNAQIDTAQSVFGGASALFDGTVDYIYTANHEDLATGNGDFCFDFRFKVPSLPGADDAIFSRRQGSGSFYYGYVFWITGQYFMEPALTNVPYFTWYDTDHTFYSIYANSAISANTWYHGAVVRFNNVLKMYINGTAQTVTANLTGKTNYDPGTPLVIGRGGDYNKYYYYGWIDEFRYSKGVPRWTSDFTPPQSAYS